MLVSSIARFNAKSILNTQQYKQNNSNTNSAHTFGGEHELSMLNRLDQKLGLDLSTNKLLYNVNYLQEKLVNKHQANDKKHALNVFA